MMKTYEGETGAAGAAPANIVKQIRDAERKITALEVGWHEALAFFDGDQYVEISGVTGRLERLETREGTASKPRHRHRRIRKVLHSSPETRRSMHSSRMQSTRVLPASPQEPASRVHSGKGRKAHHIPNATRNVWVRRQQQPDVLSQQHVTRFIIKHPAQL